MARTAAPEYRDADWQNTQARKEAAAAPGSNQPVVEGTTEARQAVTGHGVRYVLMVGLVGIVVAFAIVYAFFFAGH